MDFITVLPTSTKQNDAIMVVVEKIEKVFSLYPRQVNLQGNRHRSGIHERDIQTAWYTERDRV